MIVKHWQSYAQEKLQQHDNPKLEADALLTHCLGVSRAQLFTWPERVISETELTQLEAALSKRVDDIPFAYISGHQEFWSLNLAVDESVLIPRPETELLVEFGLEHINGQTNKQTLLDCGTGSGAIALAIASEQKHTDLNIIASDASAAALDVAKLNARKLQIDNVEFIHGHWLQPFANRSIDIILSNPPYLTSDDPHLNSSIAHEPLEALVSGDKGLDAIQELITDAKRVLIPSGKLALEHGFEQASQVRQLLTEAHYTQVSTIRDMSGLERMTWGVNADE